MASSKSSVKEFAMIGFILLAVLFGMQIMTFIFGSLNSADYFDDVSANVVNETINLGATTGIGSISDSTNVNFVSWNGTTLINYTSGIAGDLGNQTLVEGVDYQIFASNGTIGNITGGWNTTLTTYTHVRDSEAETVSDETNNASLRAIGDYADQSGTQFTTLGIAITLIILVAVFIFFWQAFMGKKKGDTGTGGFS